MKWTRILEDPALADFAALPAGGARVVVRRGYEEWVGRLGLTGGEADSRETAAGGRQPHPLVELPGGERVLVRRYLRGGAVRHLNRETYFLGHRALAELRATERARAAGVRAPTVIAVAEMPRGPGYTARFATRWIDHAVDLHAWLLAHPGDGRSAALLETGRQIGRLHAAGITHPDLNLRNLLVAPSEVAGPLVHVLDFDRARVLRGPVPSQHRSRELQRLVRSARKLGSPIGPEGWLALRQGYAEGGADGPRRP